MLEVEKDAQSENRAGEYECKITLVVVLARTAKQFEAVAYQSCYEVAHGWLDVELLGLELLTVSEGDEHQAQPQNGNEESGFGGTSEEVLPAGTLDELNRMILEVQGSVHLFESSPDLFDRILHFKFSFPLRGYSPNPWVTMTTSDIHSA